MSFGFDIGFHFLADSSFMITRRQILSGLLHTVIGTSLTTAVGCQSRAFPATHHFFSAYDDQQGQHHIAMINQKGRATFDFIVKERAHQALYCPKNQSAYFISRRPGSLIYFIKDIHAPTLQQIQLPPGRHLYGHGVITRNGRWLLTSENNYIQGKGLIGIYDTQKNLPQVDQWFSGGIGPHEIALNHEETQLIVANGGILTHPDYGRAKLNLAQMKPSLTYLDFNNGQVVAQFQPPHHQLSLRHLAVSRDNSVLIGAQFQGPKSQHPPLVFTHQGQSPLTPLVMPGTVDTAALPNAHAMDWPDLNQYIASVAIDDQAHFAVTTSPRANQMCLWSLKNHQLLRSYAISDVAGVSFMPNTREFVMSNGAGALYTINTLQSEPQLTYHHQTARWDNHLLATLT